MRAKTSFFSLLDSMKSLQQNPSLHIREFVNIRGIPVINIMFFNLQGIGYSHNTIINKEDEDFCCLFRRTHA